MNGSDKPKSLFEEIPLTKTNEELRKIITRYPNYDPFYVASGSIKERRDLIDGLWNKFRYITDRHFLLQYKHKQHFHDRMWEMYIGVVLLENNQKVDANSEGPDFTINNEFNIECIACNNANSIDKPDFVPPVKYDGKVHDSPISEMEVRFTSAFKEKYEKLSSWKKNNLKAKVEEKPYVIAINSGFRRVGSNNGYPLGYNLLFGLGNLQVEIPTGKLSIRERTEIVKGNKDDRKSIRIGYFNDAKYEEVSAVILCENDIINSPSKIGDDCILVRNPYAKYPLSLGALSFLKAVTNNNISKRNII